MPPKSEAQRRLMHAAAKGEVEGVPASVGREFVEADPGGKLPKRLKKRPKKKGQYDLRKERR